MPSDRRKDAATAATGAVMLGSGGAMRHLAVHRAFPEAKPRIHGLAMLRRAPKGKRQFWAGSAIGALGLPPLAVGTTRLIRGDVDKRNQDRRGFWREGISGTREALGERASSYREPVPLKLRAAQAGVGAGVGALGSLAARAALGRRGNALKPLLTPVAGGLAATASVPVSNRVVSHRHPEYEVTAAGVRRKKTPIKMPSSKATQHRPMPRNFARDVGKAEGYQGSRTPYIRQRAAITAAGHPPVIGPFTSSAAAARYAPPGQERKAATRQFLMGSGAGLPIGAAGAYAGAHLTARSKTAEGVATDVARAKHAVHTAARRAVGLPEKAEKGPGKLTRRFLATEAGKPFRTKAGAVGGAAGFLGAKMASGGVLGQTAITLNQRDQKRYNAKHNIAKAAGPGQTRREKHVLAQRKRRSAVLQTVGGVASLGSLGLLASGQRGHALTLGTLGSGIGGTNALLGARVQRQEAHAVDPVKKNLSGGLVAVRKSAGPLAIQGSHREHKDLIRRYGDKGPLPKGLDRDTRMKAWEARYAHHGGHKQNAYARRAEIGEGVKNAGLAVATTGGAGWVATHPKTGLKRLSKKPHLHGRAELVAGVGATVGGAGEMLAGWAHHRQSSYASSPGGVAASALRRMRDNTPDPS